MTSPIPLLLRDRTPDDEPFIYNSWLKSYHSNSSCKHTPNTIYFKYQAEIIKYLLENERVVISCFPEEPSQIIGYCVYNIVSSALVLHYLYVKNTLRNQQFGCNIIKSLLPNKGGNLIIATHISDAFPQLKHKIQNTKIIYDPFYILEKKTR